MTVLKINDKELNVKYGYEATLKTRLLSRMAKIEKQKDKDEMEATEDLLLFLPEFLLVGLQKYHSDEYGFDYLDDNAKQKQIDKVFGVIEEYFDCNEDVDAIILYNILTEEMLKNGFLKQQFQKEMAKK